MIIKCENILSNLLIKQLVNIWESLSQFVNSAIRALQHSRLLVFIDDIKLFYWVYSLQSHHNLQNYWNNLVSWNQNWDLSFNISKCRCMTFTLRSTSVYFENNIYNTSISALNNSLTELGFIFSHTLSLYLHIKNVYCRTLKTLCFIKRISDKFKLNTLYKALDITFVWKILKYSTVLWDPPSASNPILLERVQQKSLNFSSTTF